ncbi:MAG TPA: transposase [Flavisolibacter sp.]
MKQPDFTLKMHELQHEFTDRKISPWGGIKYFQQVFARSGIRDFIASSDALPQPGSNRGYPSIDLVEGFLTSVILGARRLEHCGMLRTDQVLREIFGWQKGMASASTFQRFLHRFDAERTARFFAPVQKFILAQVPIDYMTIDMDSSVLERYGKQEKAEVGYNPSKKGRPSHHPLMAFCEETKMVVNGWMRGGKAQCSTNALEFLTETLQIAGGEEKIGLLRADVGFYSHRIMSFLEQRPRPVPYLIKARMTTGVQKRILEQKRWHGCSDVAKGAIYAEISISPVAGKRAAGWCW